MRSRDPRFTTVRILPLLLIGALTLWPGVARGDQAQSFYDELGRLVRVIDGQGNVATWTYDAVGNILRIDRTTVNQARPQITGINPNVGRVKSTIEVTISGTNLLFATVTTDNPGITVVKTQGTTSAVMTTFALAEAARLRITTVTVDTGLGTATVPFLVQGPAPRPQVAPTLLVLQPNGKTASVTIGLSDADIVATTVTLRTDNPAVATVTPTQVTIPAGETSATATVTTGAEGATALIAENSFGISEASIFVATPFTGPAFVAGRPVSVDLRAPLVPSTFTPIVAPLVSVDLPPAGAPTSFMPLIAPLVSVKLEGGSP